MPPPAAIPWAYTVLTAGRTSGPTDANDRSLARSGRLTRLKWPRPSGNAAVSRIARAGRAIQATCYGTRPNHGVPQLRGVRQDLSGETTRVGTSCGGDVLEINTHSPTRFERPAERRYTGRDLNRKPLDKIGGRSRTT